MNRDTCILAIDQSTTSSRAILFSPNGDILTIEQQEFKQYYPHSGWVEHDPEEIWQSTLNVTRAAINTAHNMQLNVATIGITNQRETTLVWDRETGKPIYNAIVWQDRRTSSQCLALKKQGHANRVNRKTGLLLDPYFSATKVSWILDNVAGARQRAEKGELLFGTIDTFLIWRLTQGKSHVTDITNASRTNLYNIHSQQWDTELLKLFNVPDPMLPKVLACTDEFGETDASLFGKPIPIQGVAGDQQAASIGQCCFEAGEIKSTYGTGCFMLVNTGDKALQSQNNLLTTVAFNIKGHINYALEGSIFIAGAAVQWLRDGLGIINNAKETSQLAESLDYQHGVYLVPAFTGMGAPYWSPETKGAIFGLTRATQTAHFARATLEAVCFQTHDLLTAMKKDGVTVKSLNVDGGMIANDWLCQYLTDILNTQVNRPQVKETTALGAAYLAGLQHGIYESTQDLVAKRQIERRFSPTMQSELRQTLLNGWESAIKATLSHTPE
ncbi:glycerol kinase GlpK [Alteromonas sp. a30]|uniref:glycerol kinase GlpK n=1 Tax=Alteromonas sp. a30 TaxID=2730917 RepID=UPI002282EB67|nr:glycerol kinase GlpK [Alteromonas sp. a30]MCY7294257.1 glycerol kinase GlpK [Alteromonas sp. a30]